MDEVPSTGGIPVKPDIRETLRVLTEQLQTPHKEVPTSLRNPQMLRRLFLWLSERR